jgi:hypothetical protein
MVKIAPNATRSWLRCAELGAAVQHIGKTLVVWREKQEEVSAGSVTERPKKAVSKAKSAKALSARRGIASLTNPRKTHWFATPNKSRRNPAD